MRLITLHQPYAYYILAGLKHYETRHWSTGYRGLILVHAAARKMTRDDLWDFELMIENNRERILEEINVQRGHIIAVADLVDCISSERIDASGREGLCGDFSPGRFAFKLSDVREIDPIPFKSRQGKLIDIPVSLRELLKPDGSLLVKKYQPEWRPELYREFPKC